MHKGCPLGPVAFSVAIKDLIRHITAHMGLIWNIWYLDDGLLVGSPEQISGLTGTRLFGSRTAPPWTAAESH